jgi:phosphoglycolate phosphatase-like HAD superfamily hydrolase
VDVDTLGALAVTAHVDSAHTVLANDPVLDIARAHHGRVPLAVVSGGPRAGVVAALAAVGVRDLFDHVITIEDVEHGKPAPDLYLRALQAVDRSAATCLAYEDSEEGLAAAAATGISRRRRAPSAGRRRRGRGLSAAQRPPVDAATSCRRTSSMIWSTSIVSRSGRSGCSRSPSPMASLTARNIGT